MSDDTATARLRAIIERPERCQFRGQDYVVTPRLIAEPIGDGKQLVCIAPIFTRPNYFVARVASSMRSIVDLFRDGQEYLDAIIEAAEEEYGYHGHEEYRDDNGDETRDFPVVDWGAGCSWGKPFPVEKWQLAPPLVLWYQRGAISRWHLPDASDARRALCRSRGGRLDRRHGAALPPKNERCATCSRLAWRA